MRIIHLVVMCRFSRIMSLTNPLEILMLLNAPARQTIKFKIRQVCLPESLTQNGCDFILYLGERAKNNML